MSDTASRKLIHDVMSKLGLESVEDTGFADLVEEELEEVMDGDQELRNLNQDAARHAGEIVTGPGKRLRLVTGYSVARGLGSPEDNEALVDSLLDIEMMHAFSLFIDDVNDQDSERRGLSSMQEYASENYPGSFHDAEGIAVNQGLDVEFRGLDSFLDPDAENLSHRDQVEVLSRIVEETRKLPRGQKLDIATKWLVDEPEEAEKYLSRGDEELEFESLYMDIIDNKTAPLLVAPARVGAYMANASERTEEAVTEASKNMARAFQIRDDVIDISEGDIGKDRYSDIRDGMLNLPIHYTLEVLEDESVIEDYVESSGEVAGRILSSYSSVQDYLFDILQREELHDKELEIAGDLVVESGGTGKANELAMEFAEKADELYSSVDWQDQGYADALKTMNWYAATRSK